MAKFRFDGCIEVHDVNTAQDAINVLLTALDDYEAMNPHGGTIVIYHDKPVLVEEK